MSYSPPRFSLGIQSLLGQGRDRIGVLPTMDTTSSGSMVAPKWNRYIAPSSIQQGCT
jgi:hypothetical protein